jgi:nucleotide-binding universal stress UspA family protein
MFERVLVALDESPLSDRVLAAALASVRSDGELVLLRVRPDVPDLENNDHVLTELDVIEQEAGEILERARQPIAAAGCTAKVSADVRSGPVVATILEAAEEREVDLIVLGTHGRKGLVNQVVGAPAEQVVARAAASTFVVRAAGYPYLVD